MSPAWQLEYLPEAEKDLASLDRSQQLHVIKALEKVRQNPYPEFGDAQGRRGYGKPSATRWATTWQGCSRSSFVPTAFASYTNLKKLPAS